MKKLLSRVSVLGAIALATALVPQSPAKAAGVAAGVIQGSGTITPGLTATPTNQTVTFGGTGVGGGAAVAGTSVGGGAGLVSCTFNGTGVGETQTAGTGSGSATCTAGPVGSGNVSCTVSYARTGAVVVITLTGCTASGTFHPVLGVNVSGTGSGRGAFLFAPDQPPAPVGSAPITSYRLVGVSASAG